MSAKRCWVIVATKDSKMFVFNGPADWQKSRFTWNTGGGTMLNISDSEIASVKKLPFDKAEQLPKDAFMFGDQRVRDVYAPPPSFLHDFNGWWECALARNRTSSPRPNTKNHNWVDRVEWQA